MKLRRTMRAQRPKKKESERKSKKKKDLNLGHERDLHPPGSKSFERKLDDPKKDVDRLEDLEKEVGNRDRTNHSHVSLKEEKE